MGCYLPILIMETSYMSWSGRSSHEFGYFRSLFCPATPGFSLEMCASNGTHSVR
jgi:hypothetical protein